MTSNPHRYPVIQGDARIGRMSVTTYSPRLDRNIAIALVDARVGSELSQVTVVFPDGLRQATVTSLPFC